MTTNLRPVVVGAGIAGVACARELQAAGLTPRVLDRGHRLGGRMAVRTVDGRPVDVGASYLTARSDTFREVVADWVSRGLARPWTDTFHLATPEGIGGTTTGLMRYAAPRGLRSLVEDLATPLSVEHPYDVVDVVPDARTTNPVVGGEEAAAAVLAMPGPQARDLLSDLYATPASGGRPCLGAHAGPCRALAAAGPGRSLTVSSSTTHPS